MNRNLGWVDRVFRYVIGILLLTWAVAGGPTWTFVGVFFLITGSFGICPIYGLFRINSGA